MMLNMISSCTGGPLQLILEMYERCVNHDRIDCKVIDSRDHHEQRTYEQSADAVIYVNTNCIAANDLRTPAPTSGR